MCLVFLDMKLLEARLGSPPPVSMLGWCYAVTLIIWGYDRVELRVIMLISSRAAGVGVGVGLVG